MMRALVLSCVLALVASGASAQMLADFEGGINPFGAGTIVADPEDAGNNVLFVAVAELGTLTLAQPLAAGEAVSMKIYDQGLSAMDDPATGLPAADSRPAGTQYGWNVGVTGTWNWGVTLINKSFLGANGGYAWTGDYYDGWPTNGSVFSMNWFGGPRQVDALSIIGLGTVALPDTPGDGAWSTFQFEYVGDGSMKARNVEAGVEQHQVEDLLADPPIANPGEAGITGIYLNGSRSGGTLGGVWVDDVEIISGGTTCNPGDADGDLDVDLDDFVILKNNFGSTGVTCAEGDFDGDGDVDLDDFVLLKNNFGMTY